MEDFVTRLKQAMFLKGIKQADLAKRTGFSDGKISSWYNGRYKPNAEALSRIASALGVTPAWLLGQEEMNIAKLTIPEERIADVPILGSVAAGVPIYAQEDVIGTLYTERDPEGLFALKVKGDSMSPRIMDGDLVLAHKQEAAEDGDLVIALVEDEATCKILHRSAWGVALVPFNPAYPPFTFAGEEADRLKILGKVVESRHEWK